MNRTASLRVDVSLPEDVLTGTGRFVSVRFERRLPKRKMFVHKSVLKLINIGYVKRLAPGAPNCMRSLVSKLCFVTCVVKVCMLDFGQTGGYIRLRFVLYGSCTFLGCIRRIVSVSTCARNGRTTRLFRSELFLP